MLGIFHRDDQDEHITRGPVTLHVSGLYETAECEAAVSEEV